MLPFSDYQVYIFDCDGVLLNSNDIKITAMREALKSVHEVTSGVERAVSFFKKNFGKSRYYHVDQFLNGLVSLKLGASHQEVRESLLGAYARLLDRRYEEAPIIDGTREFLSRLSGDLYVASGSEEAQLRRVLDARGLSKNFKDIFGSPKLKLEIVEQILSRYDATTKFVMFGDAMADLEVASAVNIDFVGFTGYSTVAETLKRKCSERGYRHIDSWHRLATGTAT